MRHRFNFTEAAPDAYKAVAELQRYVARDAGLEKSLIHLIQLRASQINGCAYCVDMHVKEARRDGMSEQRINSSASGASRRCSTRASARCSAGPRR